MKSLLTSCNTSSHHPLRWHLAGCRCACVLVHAHTHTHTHTHTNRQTRSLLSTQTQDEQQLLPLSPSKGKMQFSLRHGLVHKLIFLCSLAPSFPPLSITSFSLSLPLSLFLSLVLGSYGNTVLHVSFSNETVLSDCSGCHIPVFTVTLWGERERERLCFYCYVFPVTSIQASQ